MATSTTVVNEDYLQDLIASEERLRAENEKLREALKPFAAKDCALPNDNMVYSNISFKVKDIRRARAALEGVTEPAAHKGTDEHLNLRYIAKEDSHGSGHAHSTNAREIVRCWQNPEK